MNPDRYASAWERDEETRKYLHWERSALGAAITLGKRPVVPSSRTRFATDHHLPELPPIPEPLGTIPEWADSNWRQIVDEVCAHYGYLLIEIIRPRGKHMAEVACLHEIAYRLLAYGRRGGEPLGVTEVGRILHRHHSTIRYGRRQHELRLMRLKAHDLSEGRDE